MTKPLTDLPLFQYPAAPGFKEPSTSRDAAWAMQRDAENLREKVFAAIAAAGARGATADEIATFLVRSVLSVRPRVSELTKATPPRIVPTGERRKNESGLKARVWRAR